MFSGSFKEYESMKPGLSRIKKFLKAVGDPQDRFKCVHIAGTNGKGSVAAMLASALKEGGFKTALYTSPHLADITERIKINGKDISKKVFRSISETHMPLAQKLGLTFFEYLTAVAFLYFASRKTEIAVIETGLGGRFDATNVIQKPLACIITSVAFDHKEVLGGTLKEIAFEKAGIIKKGAVTVCGKVPAVALEEINKRTRPFVYGREFKAVNVRYDKNSGMQFFDYKGLNADIKNVELALAGSYQVQNACVAACCVEVLREKGYSLNDKTVKRGFLKTKWPARYDARKVNYKGKTFGLIIDGAHNGQAGEAFVSDLKRDGKKDLTFLFAAMKEKEYGKLIKKIAPFAKKVVLVKLENQRAASAEVLKREFRRHMPENRIAAADSTAQALEMLENGDDAAAAGSLYLAGELIKILKNGDN